MLFKITHIMDKSRKDNTLLIYGKIQYAQSPCGWGVKNVLFGQKNIRTIIDVEILPFGQNDAVL